MENRFNDGRRSAGVIGGGAFGTTLASLLVRNGCDVALWVREPEVAEEINAHHRNSRYLPGFDLPQGLRAHTDLATPASSSLILLSVPSKFLRSVARDLAPLVQPGSAIVHTAKGIEVGTGRRMSEVLVEEIPQARIGVLAGPNLAREIMAGHPAGAIVASLDEEVPHAVQRLFLGSQMRIYRGTDLIGVEVGGAFKNVVALAAGAVDGMGLGDNTKALLITRGLSEMIRYGVRLGADLATFSGLAGIGDLITTCASSLSRNHTVGFRLARGERLSDVLSDTAHVAEGVTTVAAIHAQMRELGLDLHIVHAVHEVLYGDWTPRHAFDWLMANPPGSEIDFRATRPSG